MRACSRCKYFKSFEDFTKSKSFKCGVSTICKVCTNIAFNKRRAQNIERERLVAKQQKANRTTKKRQIVNEAKSVPCTDCKKSFPSCAMDLDHVRGQKYYNVGNMVSRQCSIKDLLIELSKCEVVCANCHRIRTFNRKSRQKYEDLPKIDIYKPRAISDQFKNTYLSIHNASQILGFSSTAIAKVVNKKQRSVYGYVFAYIDDKQSQEELKTIGNKLVEKRKGDKRIPVVDGNGTLYPSIQVAAETIGCTNSLISRVLKGKAKSAKGLRFSYHNLKERV